MLLFKNECLLSSNVLVFIFCTVCINADCINADNRSNDDRFSVLYSRSMKCDHSKTLNLDVSGTFVYFYDFINNINVASHIDVAANQIENSINVDYNRRLVVYVPGYKGHINRDIEESIRQTFKNVSSTYLIIIDHSPYTFENQAKIDSYVRSVLYSFYIGSALGTFLAELKFSSDSIHCVGHSLGSHILGYAGETYKNITKNLLWRITGLDPAGPCFSKSSVEEQLRTGVAKYVEVYHCNAGHLGTTQVLADTDFFFNYKGKIQPNCEEGKNVEETAKCYHKACVHYWMATVHNPDIYLARSCNSYESFAEGFCADNESTLVGYFNPGNKRGKFYVNTELIH